MTMFTLTVQSYDLNTARNLQHFMCQEHMLEPNKNEGTNNMYVNGINSILQLASLYYCNKLQSQGFPPAHYINVHKF
jgi:hypothetical protein